MREKKIQRETYKIQRETLPYPCPSSYSDMYSNVNGHHNLRELGET